MLDVSLFRAGQESWIEAIKESQRRRFKDPGLVDQVVQLDLSWRIARHALDQHRKEFNSLNKQMASLRQEKKDASHLIQDSKRLKELISCSEVEEATILKERDDALNRIGNIVHASVPTSRDESDNLVLREVGERRTKHFSATDPTHESSPACQNQEDAAAAAAGGTSSSVGDLISPNKLTKEGRGKSALHNHYELLHLLQIADLEAGQLLGGSRAYCLTDEGVMLNQALITYGIQFLQRRGYRPVQPPSFMTRDMMARTAQLSQFDEELYRIADEHGDRVTEGQVNQDRFLIATSEQPLSAVHAEQWISHSVLPIRYAGVSPCFRREAGSHGRDTLGIFRVHQFDKIEQFMLTEGSNDASWRAMDEMISTCEDFYKSLEIPYRLVSIVSGALNDSAAKKVDMEGWFPASAAYRELVSCSNCTDYQARNLGIRLRESDAAASNSGALGNNSGAAKGTQYVHMVNSTLTATQRTLCCILENHQDVGGVRIPEVLRPFMGGTEYIPFRVDPSSIKKFGARALRSLI